MKDFNMRDFEENKSVICEGTFAAAYDYRGHRIGYMTDDRSRYVNVAVDGKVIATRAKKSNAIRLAIAYLNTIDA